MLLSYAGGGGCDSLCTLSVLGEQWGTAAAQLLGGGQVTSGSTVELERLTDGGMSGV